MRLFEQNSDYSRIMCDISLGNAIHDPKHLTKTELVRLLEISTDIKVPVSIFSGEASPLEALILFLVKHKHLTIKEESLRLKRNFQTIYTTLHNAEGKSISTDSKYTIPLSILAKEKYSILETVCAFLKIVHNLKYSEIASILNRDERTVWTCVHRFMIKNKGEKK